MYNMRRGIAGEIVTVIGFVVLRAVCASASTLPPDPNNAALLYYQAILACPEADEATGDLLYNVLAGEEPNEAVREYVSDCRQAFRLVEAAGKIPACDWGIAYSLGDPFPTSLLIGLRRLATALSVQARILTSAGDHPAALARCVLMHHMARQVSQQGVTVEGIACGATQHVLGKMPLDVQTLAWLKSELASTTVTLPSLAEVVRIDLEQILQIARTNDKTLPWLRAELVKHADEEARPGLEKMTDDELIELARRPCTEFLDRAARIVDGNMPYRQAYEQLDELTKQNRRAQNLGTEV